jgi:hypothetical protein
LVHFSTDHLCADQIPLGKFQRFSIARSELFRDHKRLPLILLVVRHSKERVINRLTLNGPHVCCQGIHYELVHTDCLVSLNVAFDTLIKLLWQP